MHDIGNRLAELRKHKGWTQKQLAQYLRKSPSAVGSYEQNIQTPPADVLITLSELYHVTMDDLLGLQHEHVITLDGMSAEKKETIMLLLDELNDPTGGDDNLSSKQCEVLNAILRIFRNH